MSDPEDLVRRFYPETSVGGYSSVDGTVEFYSRVNAMLTSDMRVLDFGAGRASWHESDDSPYRKMLRNLSPRVARLIGCDVDRAVLENPAVDDSVVIDAEGPLPFADAEFDFILADWVFEHLENPRTVAAELTRVLKPGGWICARTPNRYGYITLLTRLVPNRFHSAVLSRAQPGRHPRDVFPTRFRLNTKRDIEAAFPRSNFEHYVYYYEAEPAYSFGSALLYRTMMAISLILPKPLLANLFIFLRKRQPNE